MHKWYLEGYFELGGSLQKQALSKFPQVLGRDPALDYTVQGPSISRRHAMIETNNDELFITDLGSRNGTYVNRHRIDNTTLIEHGDVLHLGETELRVIDANHTQFNDKADAQSDETCIVSVNQLNQLSQHFPSGIQALETLIAERQILPVFQPIITADDLGRCGFELLSRGENPSLPRSPIELYRLAESFSLEVILSELMRDVGIAVADRAQLSGEILVNTHPTEMKDFDRLIKHLRKLRTEHPTLTLALEIHEQAITDIHILKELKIELTRLKMRLAFDDFGVGQSRLVEMVEAKPDLIKFDRVLIAELEKADESRLNLITHLCSLAKELSIETLAEGVGTEGEYLACAKIGFDYYQGFHFSYPHPVEHFCGKT